MTQPPGPSVLSENLAGAFGIIRGRAGGLGRIDLSQSGIIWSFSGLVLAGLVDLSALSVRYNQLSAMGLLEVDRFHYLAGNLIVSLIAYAASLVALYLLCRAPHERNRFAFAVAVHNWAAPIVSLAFLPLYFLGMAMDGQTGSGERISILDLISVFWLGLLIVIALRILRISLDIPMGRAIVLFVLTTAISIISSQGLQSLLGLTGS